MGPVGAISLTLRRAFIVSRRAKRSEFWWSAGAFGVLCLGFHYLDGQVWGWTLKDGNAAHIFLSGFVIAFILPLVAVAIRRMQDVGFHGTLVFLPVLAEFISGRVRAMMFDWFRYKGIRIGHPEAKYWVRSVYEVAQLLNPLAWGLVGFLLLMPSDTAPRFMRARARTQEDTK